MHKAENDRTALNSGTTSSAEDGQEEAGKERGSSELKMKSVFLCVVFFLLLSVAVALPEDIKTISINLPSENISTVVHWFTEVKFDSTYNVVYVNTSEPYNFVIKNEELVHVWNFNVEKNGTPEFFNLRPSYQTNKTYHIFNYSLTPDSNFTFYKISFWMDDVKQEIPDWRYPFDKYSLVRNYTVPNSEGYYTYYEFPDVDIKPILVDNGNCRMNTSPPLYLNSAAGIVVKTQNKRMPIPVILQNNELEAVKLTVYDLWLGVPTNARRVTFEECPESHSIVFSRSVFPAQLLFWIMFGFLTLITIKHSNEPVLLDRLYRIYVDSSLFILFAEFTASILPPSRPLALTLFDGLIIWPLILLIGMSLLAIVKKKLENKEKAGK